MRQVLLLCQAVIYDTNCIISTCFQVDLPRSDGTWVTVDEGRFSELARNLTDLLRENRKRIETLRVAYDEVSNELITRIVQRRITDPELRAQLGLLRGAPFPQDMRYRIEKRIRKSVRGLQGETWFHIDDLFVPDRNRARLLRQTIRNWLAAAAPSETEPGDVDLALILFSGWSRLPLVSNDSHVTRFAEKLSSHGFAGRIVPLTSTKD